MLYLALVLSAILLVLAIFAAHGGRTALEAFLICGILFSMLPSLANVTFTPVVYQFLALTVLIVILGKAPVRGPRLALWLAPAVTLAVYGVATLVAVRSYVEINRLAELFPEESLEERLAAPDPVARPARLSAEAHEQLGRLEHDLDLQELRFRERTWALRTLHDDAVRRFVNSPGFGASRLLRRPSEADIIRGVRPAASVPQPAPRAAPAESLATTESRRPAAPEGGLTSLHRSAIVDFVNQAGYGYVKDRHHVAGHVPHAFSQVPEPAERWAVETLDLVSLFRHAEPVAYVSADLPRMDELQAAPTRPLDAFESAGLGKLRDGESLVVETGGPRLRMLGALRSAGECTRCHGGERGDLLGAFSYVLRRDER